MYEVVVVERAVLYHAAMQAEVMGVLGALGLALVGCHQETSTGEGAGGASTGAADGGGGTASGGGGSGEPGPAVGEADLLRAAVVLGSCWPDDGINRNLARLLYPERFSGSWDASLQVACLANAGGGCEAVTECMGYSLGTYEGSEPSACVGSVLHFREDGLQITVDCSSVGLECVAGPSCAPLDSVLCDEFDYTSTCREGGRPSGCGDDFEVIGRPCGDFGLVCSDGECRGDGASCSGGRGYNGADVEIEGLGCDGDILRVCTGGREHDVDCTSRGPGYGCQELDRVSFCGLGSECMPGETTRGVSGSAAFCEGTTVVFCREGLWERMDCLDLGFEGCSDDPRNLRGCTPNFLTMWE